MIPVARPGAGPRDMSRTVWLSGSRGFVGSHVLRWLEQSGWTVTCVSNSPSPRTGVVSIDYADRGSIGEVLDRLGPPDAFLHVGWGDVHEPTLEAHVTAHCQDAVNLINECYSHGVRRFLLVGSSSEYGDLTGSLSEDQAPRGDLNNYIKGKLAACAKGFEAASRHGSIFIHARLSYTFGAGQKPNSLVNQLYRSFVANLPIDLSPCEQYRDYIYVADAAEGIGRLSQASESAIVNLGGGKVIQLKEFVKAFWSQLGGPPDALRFGAHAKPGQEPPQPRCYLDLANLKRLTQWEPSQSVEDGIRLTIAALKATETLGA